MTSPNVTFLLFKGIMNMDAVKEMVSSDLKAAVVNPKIVLHPDQLRVAAQKSLHQYSNGQLKTKSLYTEMLYNLSPSKGIRDALKLCGVQESGMDALFVIFDDPEGSILARICDTVQGTPTDFEHHEEDVDLSAIRRLYKVPDTITERRDVLRCVMTRIASKDLLL